MFDEIPFPKHQSDSETKTGMILLSGVDKGETSMKDKYTLELTWHEKETLASILNKELSFPDYPDNQEYIDLVRELWTKVTDIPDALEQETQS